MEAKLFSDIINKLNRGENVELELEVGEKKYIRLFEPAERLILLGGGHVSLDVYRMAHMLDFDVTVVDDRIDYANEVRFPDAKVICDSFENAIRSLHISRKDYVCVLTRGHRWDKECVEAILSGEMPYYLGMIGSRRRVAGLRESLIESGFDAEKVDRLHAPIGLPIGAATTAEIALSICAEMIAQRRIDGFRPSGNTMMQTVADMETLRYLADADEPRALLIVLSSSGSTPVKSGSMMAVNRLGKGYGTIGGGCSEAAAVTRARRVIGTHKSVTLTLDMSNEVAAENGMVCGGEMTVLIEDIE